ncbi:Dabb family protein [Microterricola viridarii]|uniref:Stress responsive alpha-beta barrel domain-containing protein n=1 Tax=Microterricola viridarii TaxID=412690 RepID=A0A0X8E5C0_9MICO|nr:Dabb family protein [Microterricola viridarii]AMB59698.1 stress responsive alpha-beta barrel domain-containing protein [Microterricola viridarii]
MTIRHIVSWRLAASDPALKAAQAAEMKAGLEGLRGQIAGMSAIDVGINVLNPGANWDVVLIADYDDEAALAGYQVHPAHLAVTGFIKPIVAERSCVDFELGA